ncbi:hypothetical protein EBT16_09220 [bacterium]|nr:hypothetical protein [bacterium]NBT58948.1 hypothetical protein [bacterium]
MKSFFEWIEEDREVLKSHGIPPDMQNAVPAWLLAKIKRGQKEYRPGEKVTTKIEWEGVIHAGFATTARIPANTEVEIVRSVPGKAFVKILKPTKVRIGIKFEKEHISSPEDLYQISGWQLWNEK